jgi:hypothetical protein
MELADTRASDKIDLDKITELGGLVCLDRITGPSGFDRIAELFRNWHARFQRHRCLICQPEHRSHPVTILLTILLILSSCLPALPFPSRVFENPIPIILIAPTLGGDFFLNAAN